MKTFFQLREEAGQVTVGDYTTKHFDICPSAVKLYSNIKNMTPMVHLVVENMMLHDLFFRLEKQAIAQGSIDMDDLEKADHYAEMIMDNAEQMGLEEEHSYIEDVHMAKFEQLAGMSDDEEDEEDDESEMNEKTLTKAELKKREEVAKAIERENPNMPMAKKMAIATATAKRVAEGLEDVASMGNRSLARIAGTVGHPLSAAAKSELARRRTRNEATLRLDVNKASNDELKQYVKKSSTTIARSSSVHPDVMHTHDAAQKELKKRQKMQEEAEQIDEISRDLARRYIRKATADNKERRSDVMKPFPMKDMNKNVSQYKKMKSREKGIETAGKKAYDIGGKAKVPARESVELDELNKSTLASYTQKAAGSLAGNAAAAGYAGGQGKKTHPDIQRFMKNRMKGIQHAAKKLAKEEVENLDEISRDLATRAAQGFADKADAAHNKKDYAGFKKGEAARKMAIAKVQGRAKVSAVARRVEETELDEVSSSTLLRYSVKSAMQGGGDKGDKRIAGQKMADEKLRKKHGNSSTAKVAAGPARRESVELDEGISNLSHSRLKFHATKGVPHGSYSNKEIKDEHNRRMRTEPDYVKAKASLGD